jgi:nitrite reductase/ring-hydroxylating ferredoxin subunit
VNGGWQPVALCRDIAPGTSAGVTLNGTEIALWRDSKGEIHAWEDRCPHRGMRLSFGFVRGDHIACLYHGWEYDTAGRCRRIPAHPALDVPASICVPTWPVTESAALIWVDITGRAGETHLPSAGNDAVPLRSLYIDTPLATATERLTADNPLGPATIDGPVARIAAPVPLCIGLHAIGPATCALHITVTDAIPQPTLLDLARRAEAFRHLAESPAA